MSLVTLANIKGELKADNTTTGQDANLMRLANYVTTAWRNMVGLDFEPIYRAKKITASMSNIGGGGLTLMLDEPLLEVTSIVSDGVTLTYGTDVNAYPQDERKPIKMLILDDTNCLSWYPANSASVFNTITITGWWGMRDDYARDGWISSGDTLAAAIVSTTATTFTVADADGLDALYRTPRFSAGNLIKVDSEVMEIMATDTGTNTLTVRRGQRGTTAATHLISAAISVWNPEPDVVQALTRWACYGFARKGAFEESVITDLGQISYPADAPRQVRHIAQGYANGY
jgi:hypothetical protein